MNRVAGAAGIGETRIVKIIEGKKEQVAVYRRPPGLDKLGG